jgi:hypothetical protein
MSRWWQNSSDLIVSLTVKTPHANLVKCCTQFQGACVDLNQRGNGTGRNVRRQGCGSPARLVPKSSNPATKGYVF